VIRHLKYGKKRQFNVSHILKGGSMKKLLALVSVVGMVAMWSGCGITDPVPAPTVALDPIGAIEVGAYKNVTGKVEADSAISVFDCSIVTSAGDPVLSSQIEVSKPSGIIGEKSFTFNSANPIKITVKSGPAGSYKLKITAEAGGASADFSFDFTVAGSSDPLLTVSGSDTVFNLIGPRQGAYNLVDGAKVSSTGSETIKDLKDITTIADPDFTAKLSSGNGTVFAASTSAAYDAATKATVKTAGDAATLTTTAILSAGDVFVAKLGGSRGYAILKVLSVTMDGASDNVGKIVFEYKFTTGL
jgi:hypothetical protein